MLNVGDVWFFSRKIPPCYNVTHTIIWYDGNNIGVLELGAHRNKLIYRQYEFGPPTEGYWHAGWTKL